MDYNRVIICGRLTRDPEQRFTPKGTAVAAFGIAVNRKWTDDRGTKQEEVSFFNVECWGKTAENVVQYRRKGDTVLAEGRLKQDRWEKDGVQHNAVKVIADAIQFGPRAGEVGDGHASASPAPASARRPSAPASPPPDEPPQGDDVPF